MVLDPPPCPGDGHQLVEQLDRGNARSRDRPELSVGILLCPQFPILSLAGLIDALRHAADVGDQSRPLRCRWTVVGRGGTMVTSSSGLEVAVQSDLSDPARFDYLVVIGGLLSHLDRLPSDGIDALRQAARLGARLVGLCTGSFVLAQAGLMKGHVACVHAYHEADWRRLFPDLPYACNRDFIIDGDRITCAGGISVIELATALIERHCGADRATKVIHQMTVARNAGSPMDRRKALGYLSVENAKVREAVKLMEQNMSTPIGMTGIAGALGLGVRQLERIFQAETGMSPAAFYRTARLRYARWLITSSALSISEAACECGFSDAAHLTRHFQRQFGVTPGKLRRTTRG